VQNSTPDDSVSFELRSSCFSEMYLNQIAPVKRRYRKLGIIHFETLNIEAHAEPLTTTENRTTVGSNLGKGPPP
jgi:hypothetical protein